MLAALDFLGDEVDYANREWRYSYRRLFDICPEKKLSKVVSQVLTQYSTLTKAWDVEANSTWVCRTYLAAKMILNATVLTNTLEHSEETGLRVANPYYEYYAALSLLRAVVYTLPTAEWSNGELISVSHSRAINLAFDWLGKFDQDTAKRLKALTQQLKAQREVISYRAPASGDSVLDVDYDLYELLIMLSELAQFNSELLEQSITKNADPSSFVVKPEYIFQLSGFEIKGFAFHDSEDAYRLSYLKRKMPRPFNLAETMTEGQTEDFIGAWDADEEGKFTNGSPCDWQQIFDVP
ncbi:hypothetical protein [Oceanospirillum linum]|uniref:Uncharacterized protein n=1 Tax=Oceanospirillum linum TaxID=966 RepID=A0A1T1HDG5_OCELI|nr:hypothetical protein [Oceanospirillum linum]OOV87898.1 hypothetical protein BTA35_0207865 [Oceanospirillum linum]SEG50633.1 hypothetical protein SAMN04489856_1145 [Oleiphilus messinensis]SMP35384.1 hypothetical protein SAMN06264348_11232 [Oceanospirillum linum]